MPHSWLSWAMCWSPQCMAMYANRSFLILIYFRPVQCMLNEKILPMLTLCITTVAVYFDSGDATVCIIYLWSQKNGIRDVCITSIILVYNAIVWVFLIRWIALSFIANYAVVMEFVISVVFWLSLHVSEIWRWVIRRERRSEE